MATDTARVPLELASGRNEITAPFLQTAQRKRNQQLESDAASVDAPVLGRMPECRERRDAQDRPPVPIMVAVPLAAVPPAPVSASIGDPDMRQEQRGRTHWLAFAIAILSVGFAVWWVMAQRMPDIDPREVIARNLNDARTAMADGRYTDPPERSAFHYFSTVLAIDPANADAIAGIDAIADRHLTHARVLLSQGRIAEAGVALEKARRVRPDHDGLAVLDSQWRAALRQLLADATAVAEPNAGAIEKPVVVAKVRETAPSSPISKPAAQTRVVDVAAALAVDQPSTSLPIPDIEASVVEKNVSVSAPPPPAPVATAPAPTEPKLIKMVQPQYPQEALMRGIEGWVDVSLQVTASGDVIEPRIEDSSRGRLFNRAALAAVEQWKYEPRSDGATGDRLRVRLKFQRSN